VKLASLTELLAPAQQARYAVGGFTYCNAETAQVVVEQAAALRSPALLMIGPWEMPLLGPRLMAEVARQVAAQADVPVCLHLDHASDLELVRECIAAGFSSVMMDASAEDFERNVELTRAVSVNYPSGFPTTNCTRTP